MPDILMEQESAVPTQEVKRGLRKEKSCGLVRCLLNTSHNCQDILRSEVEAEHRRHPYSIANLGFFWYVHTPWLRVVLFKKSQDQQHSGSLKEHQGTGRMRLKSKMQWPAGINFHYGCISFFESQYVIL